MGPSFENYASEDHYVSEQNPPTVSCSAASPSGGLACAIAALAERQQVTTGEASFSSNSMPNCSQICSSSRTEQESSHYHHHPSTVGGPSHNCGMEKHQNEEEEDSRHHQNVVPEASVTGPIVPENFEEQMMLAMAVSLTEARVPPGVMWRKAS